VISGEAYVILCWWEEERAKSRTITYELSASKIKRHHVGICAARPSSRKNQNGQCTSKVLMRVPNDLLIARIETSTTLTCSMVIAQEAVLHFMIR
jgi:hypothetical protein